MSNLKAVPSIHDDKIRIDPGDRLNPLWSKLLRMWEQRLLELRQANDKPQDAESTAYLRGRIQEIKSLMSKDTDEPIKK